MSSTAVLSGSRPSAVDGDGWHFAEEPAGKSTSDPKAWVSFTDSHAGARRRENSVVVAITSRMARGLRPEDPDVLQGYVDRASDDPQLDKDLSEAAAADFENFE